MANTHGIYTLSNKGKRYILSPKRAGSWCLINPDIACCVNAKATSNWTGSFISPDIVSIKNRGGQTIIELANGEVYGFDGKSDYLRKIG